MEKSGDAKCEEAWQQLDLTSDKKPQILISSCHHLLTFHSVHANFSKVGWGAVFQIQSNREGRQKKKWMKNKAGFGTL